MQLFLDGNRSYDREGIKAGLDFLRFDHVKHSKKEFHKKNNHCLDSGTQMIDAKWRSLQHYLGNVPGKVDGKTNPWLNTLTWSWLLRHNMRIRSSECLQAALAQGLKLYRQKYLK